MRVIIAGTRTIRDYRLVVDAIVESGFAISEVICGMAKGADLFGRFWARQQRPPIPVKEFPAEWSRLGMAAGRARNWQMAEYAKGTETGPGALIAIWDGTSRGTRHMIEVARKSGLLVYVKRY